MPGLEILADNVRCTHGATSGQIDEDELFYLRSRGITTKAAQRLDRGRFSKRSDPAPRSTIDRERTCSA